MKKLGIVIDSFSGISKKVAEQEGFFQLPLQIDLDGKVFLDGVDYSFEDATSLIKNAKNPKTSLPPVEIINNIIENGLKKYENLIFLPLSSSLSGTYNLLRLKTEEYKNIHVLNNSLTGTLYFDIAKKLTKMSEEGKSIDSIIDFVKDFDSKTITYIIPKNLEAMINGGRLTGKKKYVMTTLKFIPIIKFKDKNSVSGLKRSVRKAAEKVVEKLIKFIGGEENIENFEFRIVHTLDPETIQIAKDVLLSKNIKIASIDISGGAVMVHVGYGSIALSVSPKLKETF
ncbi:DegV family protein [[Mycoplasma] mobile]|uniref:DegV homolog n=1 Tax=Mycoplasma mobile (strain ATCC 43663 / 163K / NCTC 11711) TaxID=267748 RepID=Q6KIB2_MYCM1|nr:DegV family protein [[Mycoplasma] mobile]AAT27664.1 degV homolog [Mycoplasma mobile 163K]